MLNALANVGLKPRRTLPPGLLRFRAGEPVTEQGNTVTDKKVVAGLSLSSLGASASAGTGGQKQWQGAIKAITYSATRTVRLENR